MCGIAGFIKLFGNHILFDSVLLEQLHRALAHRGPDGYGIWIDQERHVSLVHRRLRILDISDAGAQPMLSVDGTLILTFNGEIYNYLEIKAELETAGHSFKTATDTEVILHAYAQWGIACLSKLEGMFAFALFDHDRNELFLVRDRIGIKPLFLSLQGGALSFASEIKALWTLPWIEKKIHHDALSHYLTFMATPAPLTLYDGVYALPAGFYARCDASRTVTFARWYDPADALARVQSLTHLSEQDQIECLANKLDRAVQSHMRADVPIGALLSGGVDSSLIVALMARSSNKLKTFHIGFIDDQEHEESSWARYVAQRFHTEHHEYRYSESEAFSYFSQLTAHIDQPIADSVALPLFILSQKIKENGVSVVQLGEGADELFCGYPLYAQYLRIHQWWRASQSMIPAQARKYMWFGASQIPWSDAKHDLIRRWALNKQLFIGGAISCDVSLKKRLIMAHDRLVAQDPVVHAIYPDIYICKESDAIMRYHEAHLRKKVPQADFLQTITYLELCNRLPELLLMRADAMTMASAVEARVPFLDHRIVEYALSLEQSLKYRAGITKYILKKVGEKFLPHELMHRKKIGFSTPASRWFRSSGLFTTYLQDMLHTKHRWYDGVINTSHVNHLLLQHRQGHHNYAVQLWTIQMLLAQQ